MTELPQLPEERLWSLTLRELNLLVTRARRVRHFAAAHIVCTLANINRDTDAHPQPFELEEFLPPDGTERELPEVDQEALFNKMRMLVGMLGGEDLTAGMDIQFLKGDEEHGTDR